jgi:hypothetical protein
MKERMSRSMRLWWLAVMLAGGAENGSGFGAETPKPGGGGSIYEEPKSLTGSIYAAGSNKLLFKFTRTARRSDSRLEVERVFTYPTGEPAARERATYEGNNLVFSGLEELQIGARGGATIRRAKGNPAKDRIEFEYAAQPGGEAKTSSEALEENTLVNDMLAPFLQSHWEALQAGQKLKFRYIAVPRRETVGFTFVKDRESAWQGRKVIIVKMGATSFIIAQIVDPLFFTMEVAPPHHVLQYTGRTTPKIKAGAKWNDLDAVTVFDWDSAR